jgi:hypothetical protein
MIHVSPVQIGFDNARPGRSPVNLMSFHSDTNIGKFADGNALAFFRRVMR